MGLTAAESCERKRLMRMGLTGRTSARLDYLNRKLTNSLSTITIKQRISARKALGKPTGQLEAALKRRK